MEILDNVSSANCLERFDFNFLKRNIQIPNVTLKKIEEIGFVDGGKRLPKGKHYSQYSTDFKYLRVTDINNDLIDTSNLADIDEDLFEYLKDYEVNYSDIVFSIAGTLGKVASVPHLNEMRVCLSENLCRIVLIEQAWGSLSKDDYIKYLVVAISSSFVQDQVEKQLTQTIVKKLSINRFSKILIPIPEECRIQEIVNYTNSASKTLIEIQHTKACIMERRDRFLTKFIDCKSTINDTEQISIGMKDIVHRFDYKYVNYKKNNNRSFNDPELVSNYIADYVKGYSPKPDIIIDNSSYCKSVSPSDYVGMLRIQDISNENRICGVSSHIPKTELSVDDYTFLEKNDIIVAITGSIGKVAFWDDDSSEVVLGSDLLLLRVNNEICNPKYLFYLFSSKYFKDKMKSFVTGQTNGHLHEDDILAFEIPSIEKHIQDKYVSVIEEYFIKEINTINIQFRVYMDTVKRKINEMIYNT